MEDQNNPAEAAAQNNNQQQGQLRIQKIYIKDVSFETPNTPTIFMEPVKETPNVDMQISSQHSMPGENLYEVVLKVTATVKTDKKTAFLAEVHQAGLFTLTNFPPEQLAYLLGAYCPNALYPYARQLVSELVAQGGFPPLLLEPVNFDAIYAQQQAQRTQQQQAGQETATADTNA